MTILIKFIWYNTPFTQYQLLLFKYTNNLKRYVVELVKSDKEYISNGKRQESMLAPYLELKKNNK